MKYENLLGTMAYLTPAILPPSFSHHSPFLFILTLKCFEREDLSFLSQLLNYASYSTEKAVFKYM